MRIGLGYSRYAERYSQEGDTAAGLSLYSSLNPDHYTELSLGVNPLNDILMDSDLYPSETVIHRFDLSADYRWTPIEDFLLLMNFAVSGFYDTKTYRAFNLDTRTVWEETYTAGELNWIIESLIGVAFPFGEKFTCTLNLKNLSTVGDLSFTDETHPYDINLERSSENGSTYLFSDNGLNMTLNVGFVASW